MTGRYFRSTWAFGALVIIAGTAGCPVDTTLEELEATADTVVRTDLDVRRNDNYGCGPQLQIGTGRGGNLQSDGAADAIRSLVRFELDGVDADSLRRATLELTLDGYTFGSTTSLYTIQAHRVMRSRDLTPWIEGDGYEGPDPIPSGCVEPDSAAGVAWIGGPDELNDQGSTFGINNQTQPTFDLQLEDRFIVDQSQDRRGDVFELDVTDLVQDWLSGNVPNEGIMLRDPTSDGEFHHVNFGSREGESAGGVMGPRLVLEVDRE